MKKPLLYSLVLMSALSCADLPEKEKEKDLSASDPLALQQDQEKWWLYHNENIELSKEFVPLDPEGKVIEKRDFLANLTSGNYIAIKSESTDSLTYQLITLEETADTSISSTIRSATMGDYSNYLLEGQKFPEFKFEDLRGNSYNNESTSGKTLILKAWFINCKPCIAEMPELNELVEDYKDREDVVFISLATDSRKKLEDFLSRTEFNYPVVSDQEAFLKDSLGIRAYPTHIIVNGSGVISKVVNSYDELMFALEGREIPAAEGHMAPPPPPPPPLG